MTGEREIPAVSVVVPTYRGAARLPRLLDAFSRQNTKRTWELIVVLDGDADGSRAVLGVQPNGLPVRVLQLPENRGRPAALNAGFAAARGEVIVRCDDDLTPGPDYVERHATWHDDAQDLGVIGLTRDVYDRSRIGRVYGERASRLLREQAYAAAPERAWMHWAANSSVRRAMWEAVGPYDESFVDCGEDGEWGYRLVKAGGRIVIDPALEVDHLNPAPDVASRLRRAFDSGAAARRRDLIHPTSETVGPARPLSLRQRLWSGAVMLGAAGRTATAYQRLGAWIDAVLPHLPDSVARRAVAWGVESAGVAGRRHGGEPS